MVISGLLRASICYPESRGLRSYVRWDTSGLAHTAVQGNLISAEKDHPVPFQRHQLAFPVSPSCPAPTQQVLPRSGDCLWKSCDTNVLSITRTFPSWLHISSICTIKYKRKQTEEPKPIQTKNPNDPRMGSTSNPLFDFFKRNNPNSRLYKPIHWGFPNNSSSSCIHSSPGPLLTMESTRSAPSAKLENEPPAPSLL